MVHKWLNYGLNEITSVLLLLSRTFFLCNISNCSGKSRCTGDNCSSSTSNSSGCIKNNSPTPAAKGYIQQIFLGPSLILKEPCMKLRLLVRVIVPARSVWERLKKASNWRFRSAIICSPARLLGVVDTRPNSLRTGVDGRGEPPLIVYEVCWG